MEEPAVNENDILPGCSTFEDYVQAAYPIVMNGVRLSNNLPSTQQFSYFKTYPEFEEIMKQQGDRLQNTIQTLLKYMGTKRKIKNQPVHEKFELIVDTNDKLLDRAHKSMSHMDGTRQNPDDDFGETPKKIAGCWNKTGIVNTPTENKIKLTVQQRTIRPQALFKDKVDNSNRPWMPRIKEKPNSLKPLAIVPTITDNGEETYTHPYEYEIDMWKPSSERQSIQEIQEPKDIDLTDLKYIETETDLELMITDLIKEKIIGVDLEHHSYRSFMGFTCLMQISTQETDYIIDTLKLRHKMYILNSVFTKPDILKIFHGASNDIEWLQRDLSLYIVNMFDTYQAAKVLEFPKLSLSYLLKHYCQIEVSKKYQLYDWRIRPLNEKAQNYARQDTHYLIYIYQLMNNELYNKAEGSRLIEVVYQKSAETCKKIYIKPLCDENSHMNLYRRMQRPFDTRQLFALKEIYKWRDQIARQEDESPGYVLSNHMMMQIAQTLPREAQGVLACCNPIPPLVRQHVLDIHNIILKAKEIPLVKELSDDEQEDEKVNDVHDEVNNEHDEEVNSVHDDNDEQDDEINNEQIDEKQENMSDSSIDDWKSDDISDDDISDDETSDDETVNSNNENDLNSDDKTVVSIEKRQRIDKNKPPNIIIDDIICNLSFSPTHDIIILATNEGNLLPYSYDNAICNCLGIIEAHTEECRIVEFSNDGFKLYSGGKDKSIIISDLETKKMISFFENVHPESMSTLTIINENLICSGDDSGDIKIWDVRTRKPIFKNKPQDISDYISSIIYKENTNLISCTSGEGTMNIYDFKKMVLHSQSDFYKSDLTCATLTHYENHVVCGTLTGEMLMYKYASTDVLNKYDPVPKKSLNCIVSVSNNIVLTGWDDKKIRAFHLFPHQDIGIIGQHDLPIEIIELSRDASIIASSSIDNKIKFWNIQYLEDFEANPRKKKAKFSVNLPSSSVEDRNTFFSELS